MTASSRVSPPETAAICPNLFWLPPSALRGQRRMYPIAVPGFERGWTVSVPVGMGAHPRAGCGVRVARSIGRSAAWCQKQNGTLRGTS
jgi:hypothetical protein